MSLCVNPQRHPDKHHAIALDHSALLEVLDVLEAADVGDRVRAAAETVYQALIEAELTELIGAAHTSVPRNATPCATATAPGS